MGPEAFSRPLRGFLQGGRGVSAIEYALLVGLVAVGVAAGLLAFGDDIQAALANIGRGAANTEVVNLGPIAGDADAN